MEEIVIYGIDVSEWQQEIDWKKVTADGVQFAMLRATHGTKKDACFEQNISGAINAGIAVGVYCCSYATTPQGVAEEAAFLLETIEPYREYIAYPVAFDAEQDKQYQLGRAKVTELILTFCGKVKDAGYVPMNYTNCNWLNNVIDKPALAEAGIDTWVSWPKNVTGFADKPEDGVTKHEHTMWQFSSVGRIDGISGNVDLNVCYVDYPAKLEKENHEKNGVITLSELAAELTARGISHIVLEG